MVVQAKSNLQRDFEQRLRDVSVRRERTRYGAVWWFSLLRNRQRIFVPFPVTNISPTTGEVFDRRCPFEELGRKYKNVKVGTEYVARRIEGVPVNTYERYVADNALRDFPDLDATAEIVEKRVLEYIEYRRDAVYGNLRHAFGIFIAQRMTLAASEFIHDGDPRVTEIVDATWPLVKTTVAQIVGDK